jgi:DNA-binding MarR family transcriptional regulator/GNAT superfamily N-acetyltransferase
MPARVAAVRAFNRFYTTVIGILDEGLLGTPFSLAEARVIFELAGREATEVAELRRTLGIDAGYTSRILARLEDDGTISRERSAADGRRQVVRLTEAGRSTFAMLDSRSAQQIGELLSRLPEDGRRRLVGAMESIRAVLEAPPRPETILLRPPGPGDFGWVVHRHGALYAEEYGWDETFEGLVARIVAEYVEKRDPRRETAVIAEVDGEPVGSVFCTKKDARVAQLRLLLVEPTVRDMGIGTRLVDECMRFARRAGYQEITLWTNEVLEGARRIYERAGFELVGEERHHSFGHELVGQDWRRAL